MQWIGSIFVYIVLWWVVVFMVLPWGVRRQNPGPGHDPGAPAVTHLKTKLLVTTAITFVIWGIGVFLILHYHLSLTDLER